jgi:ribosomal protein S18 acetylase RimI-like enzyme
MLELLEEVEIKPVSIRELRADKSGAVVEDLATLICDIFRGPPWNEDFGKPRIQFGLGIELMRRSALLYIARSLRSGKIIGYILGAEALKQSEDPRDLTLGEIAGTPALDYLFEGGMRVFYVDGLAVAPGFRRCSIAERLSLALIKELRKQGFAYRIGRTDKTADAIRALYGKLGFQELPVSDALYPDRTYWLLRL